MSACSEHHGFGFIVVIDQRTQPIDVPHQRNRALIGRVSKIKRALSNRQIKRVKKNRPRRVDSAGVPFHREKYGVTWQQFVQCDIVIKIRHQPLVESAPLQTQRDRNE